MTFQTFQNPADPCHIVPHGLPHRATAVARNGSQNHKSLINIDKNNVVQWKTPNYSLKPLILLIKTALQLQLRQVCRNCSPAGDRIAKASNRLSC